MAGDCLLPEGVPMRVRAKAPVRRLTTATVVASSVLALSVAFVGPTDSPAVAAPPNATEHAVSFAPGPGVKETAAPETALPRGRAVLAHVDGLRLSRGVGVVGASWSEAARADESVQVRVRQAKGWGGWETLSRDTGHGPDPSSREAAGAKAATGAYVVIGTEVRLRVVGPVGRVPGAVTARIVESQAAPTDALVGTKASGSATAAALKPTIYTRAQWGADESLVRQPPVYAQAFVAFVHHTAGSNTYAAADVPAILRSIQAYHVKVQGWNDIGYTALVDRFGRLWEGRGGGLDRAVSGAHTYLRNAWSFAISAIGSYDTTTPPTAMVNSIEAYVAWRLTVHGAPPTGTVVINGATHSRISGHRDAYSTSCPGDRLYALLPTIRSAVAQRMGVLAPTRLVKSVDPGSVNDLVEDRLATTGSAAVLRGAPLQAVTSGGVVSTAMSSLDLIVASPDLTGDSLPDVIARDAAANGLRIFAGTASGAAGGGSLFGSGWRSATALVPAGDWTGDGRADLIALFADGTLRLYPGTGTGRIVGGPILATGLSDLRSVTRGPDLNGDGRADLLAIRRSDGALVRLDSWLGGGVASPVQVSAGWGAVSAVVGADDLDADGEAGDVLVQPTTGRLVSSYRVGGAFFARTTEWGSGWHRMISLSSGVDWNGDGRVDLLAQRVSDKALLWYAGTGTRDFAETAHLLTADLAGSDLVRPLGDLDGDGSAELVTRDADSVLWLRWSREAVAPTRIGPGWGTMAVIESAGDITRDGVPDLFGRTAGGSLFIYAFAKTGRVLWTIPVDGDWSQRQTILGSGPTNADASSDAVSYRASDRSVFFHRASGAGSLLAGDEVLALSAPAGAAGPVALDDLTGDGAADLVLRMEDGSLRLYPGARTGTFSTRWQPLRVTAPVEVAVH